MLSDDFGDLKGYLKEEKHIEDEHQKESNELSSLKESPSPIKGPPSKQLKMSQYSGIKKVNGEDPNTMRKLDDMEMSFNQVDDR